MITNYNTYIKENLFNFSLEYKYKSILDKFINWKNTNITYEFYRKDYSIYGKCEYFEIYVNKDKILLIIKIKYLNEYRIFENFIIYKDEYFILKTFNDVKKYLMTKFEHYYSIDNINLILKYPHYVKTLPILDTDKYNEIVMILISKNNSIVKYIDTNVLSKENYNKIKHLEDSKNFDLI
jgi:hypothetical protein